MKDCSSTLTPELSFAMLMPDVNTQKGMGLYPGQMKEYIRLHGEASELHPFGNKVHYGLLHMADHHSPGQIAQRRALWVWYGHQPNKLQQRSPMGGHARDKEGGRWWPATGIEMSGIYSEWYESKCLGQQWNRMPAWQVHKSRTQEVPLWPPWEPDYPQDEDGTSDASSTDQLPEVLQPPWEPYYPLDEDRTSAASTTDQRPDELHPDEFDEAESNWEYVNGDASLNEEAEESKDDGETLESTKSLEKMD